MNKLLAALLLTVSVSALAEDNKNFIKLEAVHYNYTSAPNDKNGINLQVGREVSPGIKLDVKQEFRVEETAKKISNRFEGGASYEQKISFVTVGARVAVGEKYTNGVSFPYYLVEPSVAYKLTDDATIKASYRYRDAFESGYADRTNTYKVGVDYKLATNTVLGVAIGHTTGDSEYTALQGGVTYKF
jgi:hypothetical protein